LEGRRGRGVTHQEKKDVSRCRVRTRESLGKRNKVVV
jgi:hypothetical protein